ncbi:MAG: chromate resistance protein [Rhodobacteraceae bacterium]|nr:chromate resistance protein [Paracoccaceae bacterium]
MSSYTEITVPQLARLIGTPDRPVLIDVRNDEDFAADPRIIPASQRRDFRRVADLGPDLAGDKVVVTCQRGLKLSHGAAAWLRDAGIEAESLEGGHEAWVAAGLPLIPVAAIPGQLWVTRHRPKIDRIACPWLIRRFVDPAARFLFVPPAEVMGVADRFGAEPFDIEGVRFSHVGERCSFDTMLAMFGLETGPLLRLAGVVRGADTDRPDLAPQAAGLLAVSVGLSRMFRDDCAQLDAGMLIYDALYRWARDGFDETHDWPANRGAA